jgi:hypothetical protein
MDWLVGEDRPPGRAGAAQNMANQRLSTAKVLRADFHARSTRLGYVARHECAPDV